MIDMSRFDASLQAETVFRAGGAQWRGAGRRPKVRCCFHDDKTPSLSLDLDRGLWKCHGCGAGGDALEFVARVRGLSRDREFVAVVEAWEAITGITVPRIDDTRGDAAEPPEGSEMWGDPADWPGIVERAAKAFADHADARAWIAARGIDLGIAAAARVGVVTPDTTPRRWWVPQGNAYAVLVPAFHDGRPFGFELRFPHRDKVGKKGVTSPSVGHRGLYHAPRPAGVPVDGVFLVEGPLDALAVASAGGRAVSGRHGASSWSDEWGEELWDQSVCVAYDDDAGGQGMMRAAWTTAAGTAGTTRDRSRLLPRRLAGYVSDVRCVDWPALWARLGCAPAGKDVGDLLLARPAEARRETLCVLFDAAERHRMPSRVRVARGGYWIEAGGDKAKPAADGADEDAPAADAGRIGPLTDFTWRVLEQVREEDGSLRRRIRCVAARSHVHPPREFWAESGDLVTLDAARRTFEAQGSFMFERAMTGAAWDEVRRREYQRLPLPEVTRARYHGRMDLGVEGAVAFVDMAGPWLYADAAIERGRVIDMVADRAVTETRGVVAVETQNANYPRILRAAGRTAVTVEQAVRAAVAPWSRGGPGDLRWAAGWTVACAFLAEVAAGACGRDTAFPVLMLVGPRGSGKTHFAYALRAFWGFPPAREEFPNATVRGLEQLLRQYASLPVFVDEYRDKNMRGDQVRHLDQKLAWVRGLYDRQGSAYGSTEERARTRAPRGALLLAGEQEMASDPGAASRLLAVEISPRMYPDDAGVHYKRLPTLDMAVVGRTLCIDAPRLWPTFKNLYHTVRTALDEAHAGQYERIRHAVALGAAGWCLTTGDDPATCIEAAVAYCQRGAERNESFTPLRQLFQWVLLEIQTGQMLPDAVIRAGREEMFNGRKVPTARFWFARALKEYQAAAQKRALPELNPAQLVQNFRASTYCIDHARTTRFGHGTFTPTVDAWVIALDDPSTPPEIAAMLHPPTAED